MTGRKWNRGTQGAPESGMVGRGAVRACSACGAAWRYYSSSLPRCRLEFFRRQFIFCCRVPVLVKCWGNPFRVQASEHRGVGGAVRAVHVLFWGRPINGMSGWFEPFGGIQIQPSEFAKPFYLLLLALLWRRVAPRSELAAMSVCFVAAAAFSIPVALEPDYGSAVIFAAMLLIFLFISGCGLWKLLLGGTLLCAIGAALAALRWDMVVRRFEAVSAMPTCWETAGRNSLLAIARCGWMARQEHGVDGGLSALSQRFHLPSIAETLGFLGTIPLLALLCALVVVLVRLARGCDGDTGKIFVGSAAFLIALQSLLHISVNATLLPPTGLTLPLISYGGSSLIGTMMLVGMALSAADAEKSE